MAEINVAERMLGILVGELRRHTGYAARLEIAGILQGITDRRRLEHFGRKIYSQNDEDGIIEEIFFRLNKGESVPGTFVEIGVESGRECNSLYLLHKGWRGTWVESNADSTRKIRDTFGSLITSKRLYLSTTKATPGNINELIGPKAVDFLSIDVDGMDIHLLDALASRPKVICIEYNAKFPPPMSKIPIYDPSYQWDGTDYMGASLTAITEVAYEKGYELVGTNITGANAFFVRKSLLGSGMFSPSTVERLYNPPRYWLTFDAFIIGHRAGFGRYVDLEQQEEERTHAVSGG